MAQQARETEESKQKTAVSEVETIKLSGLNVGPRVWQSFLERESVATIMRAVILSALTVALVIAMFSKVKPADVLSNATLIILGYFFGQSVSRPRPSGES